MAPDLSQQHAKQFLVGRRSARRFRDATIDRDTLRELLSIVPYAPTASNAQDVAVHVMTGSAVRALASSVNDYYRMLARLISIPPLWPLLWFTALRPYLADTSKTQRVKQRVIDFTQGDDWIFFNAPAVVVLSAPRSHKMFGRVNCTIAAERIQQYAFAVGLGSCYIGYAEVALRGRARIRAEVGMPRDRMPGAVFCMGHPLTQYSRLPARRAAEITWKS